MKYAIRRGHGDRALWWAAGLTWALRPRDATLTESREEAERIAARYHPHAQVVEVDDEDVFRRGGDW